MPRLVAALAATVLAAGAAAQTAPPAGAPPAAAPAQPAPSGRNARAIDRAKSLGKAGVQKLAPKLGRGEVLVRKQGGRIVEKAVDLAAEKAGLAPRR